MRCDRPAPTWSRSRAGPRAVRLGADRVARRLPARAARLDVRVVGNDAGANELHRNEGGGIFSAVSGTSITQGSTNTYSVAWGDYDGDGDVRGGSSASLLAGKARRAAPAQAVEEGEDGSVGGGSVSYTHLTLPTKA